MEVVANLRGQTTRGVEKVAGLWRQSLAMKVALALSALLPAVLAFALISAWTARAEGYTGSVAPMQVSGVFADVNGDGLVDYIVSAEVIVNKGPLAP